MVDKATIIQIFGSLMKHPQFLSESDKYNLTPDDFQYNFEKSIFIAIDSLYRDGAKRINPIDIENFLSTNATAATIFKQNNGIEYLQDADYVSDSNNFAYYYKKLKKFNLLFQLKKQGIDIKDFYSEDLLDPSAYEKNKHFEELEISDIIDTIKKKTLGIERKFIQNDVSEVQTAFTNIMDVLNDAEEQNDVGYPLQGNYFNEVISGARLGALLVRSAGSGTGKTRQAVGDACYLAYPMRFNPTTWEWEKIGNTQRVLLIVTEQNFKEVQKMILAYLTGFNESKFRYGHFTKEEEKVIAQTLIVMEKYEQNIHIVRVPNPTIELIKNIVRENVLMYDIKYVFYDYIFIGPALIGEFRGVALRNDEILLMFATALKDLAVELNVFVATSTQVNSAGEGAQGIKNESSIAGSKAIINKADYGCIMSRPSNEELAIFEESKLGFQKYGIPNLVTDMYKVRSGEWTQVRIWSNVDLGTLRKTDLFVTDGRMNIIEDFGNEFSIVFEYTDEELIDIENLYKKVVELNGN